MTANDQRVRPARQARRHAVPRPEYPRPQFRRSRWLCLNGPWEFEVDKDDTGLDRGLLQRPLTGRITVPYCPESTLSGIGRTDFMECVWYRRHVRIPYEWAGSIVLLHFQAVDHDATVWANGVEVARHRGGFTPFSCDLSRVASPGTVLEIVVRARDSRYGAQARGKQSTRLQNYEAVYTRTTGIWQTVWLEPVPPSHLLRPRVTPDVGSGALHVQFPLAGGRAGHQVVARLTDESGPIAAADAPAGSDFAPQVTVEIPSPRRRLWSLDDPHLYELRVELRSPAGEVVDALDSYAGLRSVSIDGRAVLLNGRPVFQRLVLDQGYYADGIMTAPDDDALVRDIELAKAAGFNGARLHQKVFEERYLSYADRLGYLVWGEFGDTGAHVGSDPADGQQPTPSYVAQWLEAIERDYSHPSIIGWCPLNETFQLRSDRISQLDDVTRAMFLATKAMDLTRPVIDASGYSHRIPEADIYDAHYYTQDADELNGAVAGLADGRPYVNTPEGGEYSIPYHGQPYFLSEFGGTWWSDDTERDRSWGYGERPKDEEEVYRRFAALTGAMLENPALFGYCYTQLTDVFQERNGVYRFDRSVKLDPARLRSFQQRPAAIETTARRPGEPQPSTRHSDR